MFFSLGKKKFYLYPARVSGVLYFNREQMLKLLLHTFKQVTTPLVPGSPTTLLCLVMLSLPSAAKSESRKRLRLTKYVELDVIIGFYIRAYNMSSFYFVLLL